MKKSPILLLLACAFASMTSCSHDSCTDMPAIKDPSHNHRTINVRILANSLTRSGETPGDEDIKSVSLAFYDSEGNFLQHIRREFTTPLSSDAVYSVELKDGIFPDKVYALANADFTIKEGSSDEPDLEASLDAVEAADGTVPMSSASYFTSDGTSFVRYSDIPVSSLMLGKEVDIFLERLAAKVTVENSGEVNIPDLTVTGKDNLERTLSLEITGWGVNATDGSTRILKNISDYSAHSLSCPDGITAVGMMPRAMSCTGRNRKTIPHSRVSGG